jgi:hypothetical protein
MNIVAIIRQDIHPSLLMFLKVPTVNLAEVLAGGIVLTITDPEAIAQDIRTIGRRIEEVNRVMVQTGHYQIAASVLSGNYHDCYKGIIPRRSILIDKINTIAGRDLTAEEINKVLDYVNLRLKIRRVDGKKNSFTSVLTQLKEAVNIFVH